MKLIFATEDFPTNLNQNSIFLAGPTPRNAEVKSWRPEMVYILASLNFDGYIILPESRNGKYTDNYNDQIEWEHKGLTAASCILFWIPRSDSLPGFTTNCEWGEWKSSNKVVLGYPMYAKKMSYLHWHAERLNIPISHNMLDTAKNALNLI